MRRVFGQAPIDEDGRIVLNLGGKCPSCGMGPAVKYSRDGRVVLYHQPEACNLHAAAYRDSVMRRRKVRINSADDEAAA